jgi:hypothetical protein
MEEWKDIKGYEGFQVSNKGRVITMFPLAVKVKEKQHVDIYGNIKIAINKKG